MRVIENQNSGPKLLIAVLSRAAGKCGVMAAMLFLCDGASPDEMVGDEQSDLPYPQPFSCLATKQREAPAAGDLHPPHTWNTVPEDIEWPAEDVQFPLKGNDDLEKALEVEMEAMESSFKEEIMPKPTEIVELRKLKEEIMPESKEEVPVEFQKPKEEIMPQSTQEVPVEFQKPKEEIMPQSTQEVPVEFQKPKEEIMPQSTQEVVEFQKPKEEIMPQSMQELVEFQKPKEEMMPQSMQEVVEFQKPKEEIMPQSTQAEVVEFQKPKEEIMSESKEEVPVEPPVERRKRKEKARPEVEENKPLLPAIEDKPKMRRLTSKQPPEAIEVPSAKVRAKHGTAGTFAGRRPPKDPILKATFESIRDTFPEERVEAKEKYGITLSQDNYWFHMQKALKSNNGNFDLAYDEFKKHLAVEYSRADGS